MQTIVYRTKTEGTITMNIDISQQVQILRDKYSKEASFEIKTAGVWKLYAGNTIDNIDLKIPILEGEEPGIFPLDVSTSARSYFKLITPDKEIFLAEKHLPMAGGYNFRDMGGFKTDSGKYVKWGKLFRADELSGLTDEDINYLSAIPITSIVDFRAISETRRSRDKLPSSVRFLHPLPITPGNLSSEGIQANLLKTNINIHMKQMNRLLVSEAACVKAYRIFFTIIQNSLSAPLIFHCSAGKDRTGMAAALLLFALGVDEETIKQDYLSSKIYLADKYDAFIAKYPKAEPIFTVKRTFIQAGINQIKREHGTIENFLTKTLRVDIEKIRQMYLE